jgi:hypothetical protein
MELMQSNVARMATYGIAISIPQLTLTLITNIENATKAEYGREFDRQCRLFAKNTRTTMYMMPPCYRIL